MPTSVVHPAFLVTHENAAVELDHALAHQVHDAELDPELLAHGAGVRDILFPGAMTRDVFLVDPVLHVGALDGVALACEQQGGGGAVNAAGHGCN